MKDQVHIRNAEAAQLARALARQTGKTLTEIVLDALQQYRPGPRCPTREDRVETWRRLLREDREGMTEPETSVESLNDDAMGLPA